MDTVEKGQSFPRNARKLLTALQTTFSGYIEVTFSRKRVLATMTMTTKPSLKLSWTRRDGSS